MSFSFSKIYATRKDADTLIGNEYIPDSVRTFIVQALAGIPDDTPVSVVASGHLYEHQSYNVSTASIRVEPMVLYRAPTTDEQKIIDEITTASPDVANRVS